MKITSIPPATLQSANNRLTTGRAFNDDLLINDQDLEYAREQFPKVIGVLDHPELRTLFVHHEEIALKAQTRVIALGFLAIFSATIALLSAATAGLWHGAPFEREITVAFELAGLFATLVAGGSLWLGPWQKQWIESRFMVERLRQWHFQLILRKGKEIEAAIDSQEGLNQFTALRKKWFDKFVYEFSSKLGSRVDAFATEADPSSDWLIVPQTHYGGSLSHVASIFDVYYDLRLKHQHDYITHKLSDATDKPLWVFLKWPTLRQEAVIKGLGSACFVAALFLSFGIIINQVFEIRPHWERFLDSATIVTAIIGISLRAVKESFGMTEDIERYRGYREKLTRLILRFEAADSIQSKLQIMEEVELLSVDELRGFLRTHRDSAFLL